MNEVQGKWSYQSVSSFLNESYSALSPQAALAASVQALAGVTPEMATVLQRFGISTVMDLAASGLFDAARRIVSVADSQSSSITVPGDLVDATYRGKGANVLAAAPITALNGIGAAKDARLAVALRVTSIRDLADWRPYRNANVILQQAYGVSENIVGDPERPDDLIPIPRRYATERVQYDVIVLDRVIMESAGTTNDVATPATMVPPSTPVSPSKLQDIVTAGGIDISDVVASALTAKLAVGAVLTYRQSWFPQGLALGQLLHSMALAPGESTRIAMVDWSRRVRGTSTDDTTQTELLAADMGRARSMSEVTASVAREAQSGFSGSASVATENQSGTTSGQSNVGVNAGVKSPSLLASIGAAIFGGEGVSAQVGIGSSSSGTSSANSTATTNATGWASSNGSRNLNAEMQQNISDRTHQAANSVRNRRATTVTESSQAESEKLSTRVVTNYNHMHALTIEYFEVVQIYRVMVELSRVTRCLFLPMKLVTFSNATIKRFRDVIARAALIPGVRALQWAEPDHVVINAPAKAGTWNAWWLDAVSKALGDEIGFPNDASIVIRKSGLTIGTIGGDSQDVFEELIVEFTDGTSKRVVIPESNPNDVFGWQGYNVGDAFSRSTFMADNFALSPDRFSRFVLKRRAGQEAKAGVANIHLLYDIRLPDGTQLGDRPDLDAPTLVLPVPIRYESNEPLTVAFEFGVTLAQADVLSHLNQNALHYSTAIWRSLDAATITTMLSSYSLGNRPLIEQIDPLPVAVSGNYVIFRSYAGENDKEWQSFLKRHDLINPIPQEDMIPLPSSGVFAEAVLGRSNSAEKLDITRFWNWQDSPIPILPPEINPLTAGGKANDPTVKTAPLEGQVLNIVNPPALPDPTGLAPLYSAIANGNMFRDMSGMAQVAALAQAALQTAQAGATSATGAAGQAQQVAATQLTEFLKLIAQVATGAMTGGGGAGLGAIGAIGGAATGGAPAKPGVANTPSNAGALINHGKSMDDRGLNGPLSPSSAEPVRPSSDPASELLLNPGGSSGNGSPTAGTTSNGEGINRSLEAHAAEVAITGSGGVGGGPLGFLRSVLNTTPRDSGLDAGTGASQAKFPWGLLSKWSGSDQSGVTFTDKYHNWVDQSYLLYNNDQFLCNWYPLKLLVDFAAANGLRIQLHYWQGSARTDGSPRLWDTTRRFVHDSHSGRFETKEAFFNTVKSTVTARMIGILNTLSVDRSAARVGDLVLYDYSDAYWHTQLIVSISPTSMTLQAGNTPMCNPTENARTAGAATPSGAYGGSPRRWDFAQFDGDR
jgi:hypothetical protein